MERTSDVKRLCAHELLPLSSEAAATRLADGIMSFALFENDHFKGLLVTAGQSEAELVDWSVKTNTTILIRRSHGGIELYLAYRGLLLERNRAWTYKPNIHWTIEAVQRMQQLPCCMYRPP